MSQLSLFEEEYQEVIIPSDVISPLESNASPSSKKFKEQQKRWSDYVRAIQDYHQCSWNEARSLLIEHRDEQKNIKLVFN